MIVAQTDEDGVRHGLVVRLVAVVPVVILVAACTGVGQYVWVDQYPQTRHPAASPASHEYVIGPGDVLNVRVFDKDNMSAPHARINRPASASISRTAAS